MNKPSFDYIELIFPKLKQVSVDTVSQCISIIALNVEIEPENKNHRIYTNDICSESQSTHFMVYSTQIQLNELQKLINRILQISFETEYIEQE